MKVVAPISSAMKKVNYATGDEASKGKKTKADVRKQPELENHVEIGGYSYPTLVALNIKKGACAPLKMTFVKAAGLGRKGTLPLEWSKGHCYLHLPSYALPPPNIGYNRNHTRECTLATMDSWVATTHLDKMAGDLIGMKSIAEIEVVSSTWLKAGDLIGMKSIAEIEVVSSTWLKGFGNTHSNMLKVSDFMHVRAARTTAAPTAGITSTVRTRTIHPACAAAALDTTSRPETVDGRPRDEPIRTFVIVICAFTYRYISHYIEYMRHRFTTESAIIGTTATNTWYYMKFASCPEKLTDADRMPLYQDPGRQSTPNYSMLFDYPTPCIAATALGSMITLYCRCTVEKRNIRRRLNVKALTLASNFEKATKGQAMRAKEHSCGDASGRTVMPVQMVEPRLARG
ncbi:protein disulfide isomerase-like 2-3 [Artemisia annua]|uniref:Protein disulfide isomerase-like 2-3 n=1 Tax=Artemisia annua TaxID=35608 RepID=A0A2U1NGR6_ARTAN|nr:protein disulfide isomerase-like 2-3 [Artemisia annua]